MWPFDRPKTPISPPVPGLEDRLGALERSVAELRADVNLLRREWADTLDKLQTWFGREAARKRKQLHTVLEQQQEAASEPAHAANGGGAMTKAELRRIAAQRRFQGGV